MLALILATLTLLVVSHLPQRARPPHETTLSALLARASHHQVKTAELDSPGHTATVVLANAQRSTVSYPAGYEGKLTTTLLGDRVTVTATRDNPWPWYGRLAAWLLLLLFVTLLFYLPRIKARLDIGRKQVTHAPPERFADVKGADEAVAELKQLADFLNRPDRYIQAGVRIPRGWLFHGPPGTGKTLLARAVAGEADVPFFSISGSEFAAKYIGEGAAKVRALFSRARIATSKGWSIVFIDEIDALGANRESETEGGHEYAVTLNQLLTEMDGFLRTDSKVIVIGATNRPHTLDPALLRAGRLTRQIAMPKPDISARAAVLRKHASALARVDPALDVATLARITNGCSGADLAELVNAAGLLALRQGASAVTTAHCKEALATAVMGHARTTADIAEEDRKITAAHEAGHALVAFLLPTASKPHQVSIVPRGESAGATWMLSEDRQHFTAESVRDQLAVTMAGRAAEKLALGLHRFSAGGAADDMANATAIALQAVCEWGLGRLTSHIDPERWQDHPRANQVADNVDELLREAEYKATSLLLDHRAVLDALTAKLLQVETLTAADIAHIANQTPADTGCTAAVL